MKYYPLLGCKKRVHAIGRSLMAGSLCLTLMTFHYSLQADAKPLYRYTQPSGNIVISDSIPPEYASQGYEIIDSRGNIIKTVPKELSEAEKAQRVANQKELARLAAWDKELLARYSQVSDLESRKKRRIAGIKNSIDSLKLTLKNISNTISYYKAEAAADERQGEAVAKETVGSIARLQKDKDFISNEIARKEKEEARVTDSFNKDIERFKLITSSKSNKDNTK